MIELFLIIVALTIFVEAITEILVSSSLLERPRDFIGQRSGLLGELIHCGYCTSVWVSASVAWLIPLGFVPYQWLEYMIATLILHRLSNMFHELACKWMQRAPIALAIHKTETIIVPEQGLDDETI